MFLHYACVSYIFVEKALCDSIHLKLEAISHAHGLFKENIPY